MAELLKILPMFLFLMGLISWLAVSVFLPPAEGTEYARQMRITAVMYFSGIYVMIVVSGLKFALGTMK